MTMNGLRSSTKRPDLSRASGVETATIYRMERDDSSTTGYVSTLSRIQAALEAAGVLFIMTTEARASVFG